MTDSGVMWSTVKASTFYSVVTSSLLYHHCFVKGQAHMHCYTRHCHPWRDVRERSLG